MRQIVIISLTCEPLSCMFNFDIADTITFFLFTCPERWTYLVIEMIWSDYLLVPQSLHRYWHHGSVGLRQPSLESRYGVSLRKCWLESSLSWLKTLLLTSICTVPVITLAILSRFPISRPHEISLFEIFGSRFNILCPVMKNVSTTWVGSGSERPFHQGNCLSTSSKAGIHQMFIWFAILLCRWGKEFLSSFSGNTVVLLSVCVWGRGGHQ